MKTTLLIGTKLNTVTLIIEPETAAQRIILEELQRRGVMWEVSYAGLANACAAVAPAAPAKQWSPLDMMASNPATTAPADPRDPISDATMLELVRSVLPEMPSVFHYREIKAALAQRYPDRDDTPYGVYNGVGSLIRLGEIKRTPGGFMLGDKPAAAVMTPAAETVAR